MLCCKCNTQSTKVKPKKRNKNVKHNTLEFFSFIDNNESILFIFCAVEFETAEKEVHQWKDNNNTINISIPTEQISGLHAHINIMHTRQVCCLGKQAECSELTVCY